MIGEETLRKWRKDALEITARNMPIESGIKKEYTLKETQNRILKITQELLDQHLLREEENDI